MVGWYNFALTKTWECGAYRASISADWRQPSDGPEGCGAQNENDIPGAVTSSTWYVKVGHKWGNNAVSVSYGESEDADQDLVTALGAGWKDKGFQIGFNHNIPKAKVDLYAGVHGNQLDLPNGVVGTGGGTSVDDIYAVVVGTKLKFD